MYNFYKNRRLHHKSIKDFWLMVDGSARPTGCLVGEFKRKIFVEMPAGKIMFLSGEKNDDLCNVKCSLQSNCEELFAK